MDILKFFTKKELTEEEKKKRIEKKAFSKKNRSHSFAKKVLVCFVVTYGFFFSSGLWLSPDSKNNIPSFHTAEDFGRHRQITLIRYDFCEEQETAEIELDITQLEYEKGDLYLTAYLDDTTTLPISFPVDDPDTKVIRITGIESASAPIKLECLFERSDEDVDTLYFEYKPKNVTQVASLTEKTEAEYKIQRCHLNIDNYREEIEDLNEQIAEQQAVLDDIADTNSELEEIRKTQTAEEQEESAQQIERNLAASETASETIKDYQQQILEIDHKITEENQKIKKLQTT